MEWIKNYFKVVPIWLIIVINLILACLLSGATIIAVACMNGIFFSSSNRQKILGILILIGEVLVTYLINWITYKIKLKKSNVDIENINHNKKSYIIFFIMINIIIVISFLISAFFPNIFLFFNGWWF